MRVFSICSTAVIITLSLAALPPAAPQDQTDSGGQATASPPAAAAAHDSYLRVEKLYNGIDRPIMLTVDEEAPAGELAIVLLEYNGKVIVPEYDVRHGQTLDLAEELPIIRRLRRAAYLQLLCDGTPVGSALVLQPMLSRPPIWTQKDVRPDGRTVYTRIVGWGSEPPEGWESEPEMQDTDGDGEPDTPAEPEQRDDRSPEIEPEVMSGLRIYPERDVILQTTHGDMRIAMAPDEAPNTAWNFVHLARHGFYDDVIFHRIVPLDRNGFPFVIQGGDPSGTGSGGPGYWLPMEPSGLRHDFGVISMARADDPDSAGSQFFICLSREGTARLDGQYCAFGYVVEGAATIRAIADVDLEDPARGRPVEPPVIIDAEVVPSPPRVVDENRLARKVSPDEDVEEKPLRVPR